MSSYRMSENYEEEILRLNKRVRDLMTYSEKAAADNSQLLAENRALKIQCNNYHEKYHSLRDVHFKNQLRFHDLEEIRDKLYESNQKHKINNNKYLDMIRKQAERIRQMENSLKVQTMRGSMIRNSVGGPVLADELPAMENLKSENDRLRKECHEVQEKLNESYNIIDELEFELETLDFVEADRDHLQRELKDARIELEKLRSTPPTSEEQLLNREFPTLTVADSADGGEEDAATESEEPAGASFAAFAVAEDVAPESAKQQGNKTGVETAEATNEWKKRRQELHKRLEILHQRQQVNVDLD